MKPHWLSMHTSDVLRKFACLPKAYILGNLDGVFVPGGRTDRILIIAHADTYLNQGTKKFGTQDGIIFSKRRSIKEGLGADNRAGCSMAWELRGLGHSLLITNGNYDFCLGARNIMESTMGSYLNNSHNFVIQLDHHKLNSLYYYDKSIPSFEEYISSYVPFGIEEQDITDMKYISQSICGVNISAGFSGDKIYISEYNKTLGLLSEWLNNRVPRFLLDRTCVIEPRIHRACPVVSQKELS